MEIDLSAHRLPLLAIPAILLLAGLAGLGYTYAPEGAKVLSQLQAAAESLSRLLNDLPDPVRAQITASSIQRLTSQGQPALQYQRESLAVAAQAVSDWAVGAGDRETALKALDQ